MILRILLSNFILSYRNLNVTYDRFLLSFVVLRLIFSSLKVIRWSWETHCLRLVHWSISIGLVSVLNRSGNSKLAGDRSTLSLQLLALVDLPLWFRNLRWSTFLSSFGTLLLLWCQLFATIGCFWSDCYWFLHILTRKHLLSRRIPRHLLLVALLLLYLFVVCHYITHLFFVSWLRIWTHILWIQHYSLLAWFHIWIFIILI